MKWIAIRINFYSHSHVSFGHQCNTHFPLTTIALLVVVFSPKTWLHSPKALCLLSVYVHSPLHQNVVSTLADYLMPMPFVYISFKLGCVLQKLGGCFLYIHHTKNVVAHWDVIWHHNVRTSALQLQQPVHFAYLYFFSVPSFTLWNVCGVIIIPSPN